MARESCGAACGAGYVCFTARDSADCKQAGDATCQGLCESDGVAMPLTTEIQLLLRAEFRYGVPAKPIINQLLAESERPLPDAIPPKPPWVAFQWPKSGEIGFIAYWHFRKDEFWGTSETVKGES